MKGEVMEVRDASLGYVPRDKMPMVPMGYKQTEVGVIPDDWDIAKLEEIAHVTSGKRLPAGYYVTEKETPHPYIRVSDMYQGGVASNDIRYVPEEAFQPISQYRIYSEDLFISVAGTLGLVGAIPDSLDGANLTENANRISNIVSDRTYLLYVLLSDYIQGIIESIRTVGAQPKLALTRIRKFEIPLPPTREEQGAIATALSDVDALLEALDRLIAKKRDIKQATMQQLLTAQTRLPGFEGEWDFVRLGDLGMTYGGLTGKSKADFGTGPAHYVPFLSVMENIVIRREDFERVRVESGESQNSVKQGDLLFNGSSETPEEVAMCALVKGEYPNLYLNSFCFGFRLNQSASAHPLFLVYYLRSDQGREVMKSLAQGSTRYNLSKSALLKATICTPSFEEQASIAAVLAEMNAELETLQQRRTKTAALKQAMMQELLTGRTRLVDRTSEKALHG